MGYRTYQTEIAPAFLRDSTADAWHRACGDAKDDEVDRLKRALKARMPLLAQPDAVAEIGIERGVERLPGESDASYAQRVVHAWESWQWAGTPYGVLVALSDLGYPGAVLVIPNGKSHRLVDGELTIEDLPTGSWSIAEAGWARFDVVLAKAALSSDLTFVGTGASDSVYDVIGTPTGTFGVVIEIVTGGMIGVATLKVSVDGGVTWGPTVAVPDGEATIDALGALHSTGMSVNFSDSYGAFVAGDRWSFQTIGPAVSGDVNAEAIRRAVAKWAPGHTAPSRLAVINSGEPWGWPVGTWGESGAWGADVTEYEF